LHNAAGDIRLIVPDGKTQVTRQEPECGDCARDNLAFASRVARALAKKP
jgi:hypothetical protein